MSSLFLQVRTKLRLAAKRKIWEALEGNYASVLTGRSMDFVDLREYVPGDDVKDIDWKATARSSHPLVKRYVAERKHNVLLIVDAGRAMGADASAAASKQELALCVAGGIAYLAYASGDRLGLVLGSAAEAEALPFRSSGGHMERVLRRIQTAIAAAAAPSDLSAQLAATARLVRRRCLVVVIGDDGPLSERQLELLRRLRVQHELSWVSVADLNPAADEPTAAAPVDVDSAAPIPAFLTHGLREAFAADAAAAWQARVEALRGIGIPAVRVSAPEQVVPALVELLERQRAR